MILIKVNQKKTHYFFYINILIDFIVVLLKFNYIMHKY